MISREASDSVWVSVGPRQRNEPTSQFALGTSVASAEGAQGNVTDGLIAPTAWGFEAQRAAFNFCIP